MADLRIIRPRAGIRIYLYPGEMAEAVCDPDLMAQFTQEEIAKIILAIQMESNRRESDVICQSNPKEK